MPNGTLLTLHRLCELLIDMDFDPLSHVSRSAAFKCRVASNGSHFILLCLPHTKTKENSDDISMTDTQCNCSPVATFDHHLMSNASVPSSTPMFTFETGEDAWSPMRCSWFLVQCNEIWAQKAWCQLKVMASGSVGPPTFYCWESIHGWSWYKGGGALSHSCPTGANARKSFCSSSVFHFSLMNLFYLLVQVSAQHYSA